MTTGDPTRVLWLIRGLGPGGAERLLVAHALAAGSGFHYEVAYQVKAKDHLVPELEAAGVTVHRLGTGPSWPLELRKLVAERTIDVVHSHSPAMAAGARLALRALPGGRRPRLVYTEHNRWDAYRLPTRWANASTLRLEDHILAVSDEARDSVSPRLRGRVETLHHGIDRDRVRAAAGDRDETRASLGVAPETMLAIQIANFRIEKAHEVLLDAAELLIQRDVPVRFLLVGQGQRLELITDLVAQRKLGGSVELLGYRDDVAKLLGASDMLVLSSDHEGLPVAIMESLALGVPVVSTSAGGVPEAIDDGVEGLLVPTQDPKALADAIERVCRDEDLRHRLGLAAAERSADFDAKVAAAKIESIYGEAG